MVTEGLQPRAGAVWASPSRGEPFRDRARRDREGSRIGLPSLEIRSVGTRPRMTGCIGLGQEGSRRARSAVISDKDDGDRRCGNGG